MKNTVIRMLFVLFMSILVGTSIMIGLYAIPVDKAFDNAALSKSLYRENMIGNFWGGEVYATLSNFTDSIIINNAVYRPYENAIQNALLNPRAIYPDSETMTENLYRYLEGETGSTPANYDRYWHGYLLYMIPLLSIMKIGDIKAFLLFVQTILLIAVLNKLSKIDELYAMLFGVVVFFINPITTSLTFQEADIYIISLVFSLIVLNNNTRSRNSLAYIFLMDGIMVAFFDFLTYPTVAIGIPISMLLLSQFVQGKNLRGSCLDVLISLVSWGCGYLGMWFGKWIMAYLLTGSETITDSFNEILFWTSRNASASYMGEATFSYALKCVYWKLRGNVAIMLFCITVIIGCYYIFLKKYRGKIDKAALRYALIQIMVGTIPFVWVFVTKNHTIVHPHLSYRNFSVTLWAFLLAVAVFFVPEKNIGS